MDLAPFAIKGFSLNGVFKPVEAISSDVLAKADSSTDSIPQRKPMLFLKGSRFTRTSNAARQPGTRR